MTDEYLIERGYKQYPPMPPIDNDSIVAKFQKRFDDDFGKKYFISVAKWSRDYVPENRKDKWWTPFVYEYDTYVTMFEEEEKPIWLKFGTSWTIEEVENYMEEFFEKMKPNYYEDWHEHRAVRPK